MYVIIYDRFVFSVLWAVSKRWAWWALWSECLCENDTSWAVPEVTTGRPYEGTWLNLCFNPAKQVTRGGRLTTDRIKKTTNKRVATQIAILMTLYSAFRQYSESFIFLTLFGALSQNDLLICTPNLKWQRKKRFRKLKNHIDFLHTLNSAMNKIFWVVYNKHCTSGCVDFLPLLS